MPRRPSGPRKPALPEERPRVPREVFADLRASSRQDVLDDVVRAYAGAGRALADGDPARAVELLEWAKAVASRSGVVREALGVARYHLGDFPGAHRELLAYRRLTGRQDQNHLLADCARAIGRRDKIAEYVAAMDAATDGADRVAEGVIVVAADRAERGDVAGALAELERHARQPPRVEGWHLRMWHLAADLAGRLGDAQRERDYLEAITVVDPDYLDAAERLEALGD